MSKKKSLKNKKQAIDIKNKLEILTNRVENNVFIFQSNLTVNEFAKAINRPVIDILKIYFNKGIMTNQNALLNEEEIGELCLELNLDFKKEKQVTIENLLENFAQNNEPKLMIERSPVVTIMGHVDHGKTTLLDKIRNTSVAASEKGGITQAIGAYEIKTINNKKITFIDTPGHKLFTEMRARGSQVTDIVVIVVAGSEGVKPQTIEAIDHAKSAKVPIIVFVNKSDHPEFDFQKTMLTLSNYDLMPEEWGGNIPYIQGSAKTGEGIENLLENIILLSDVLELKANVEGYATGIVIESSLDKFLGPKATLLIKNGTLQTKNYIIAGYTQGRVRIMKNDRNIVISSATASTPVSILGLSDVPKAGDHFMCFYDEKLSKKIAAARKINSVNQIRNLTNFNDFSLDKFDQEMKDKVNKVINIIVRADTFGSVEVLKSALSNIDTEKIKINIVRAAVGSITENDVTLAMASNSIIYGFNIRPNANVYTKAEANNIQIKLYSIIYELIEDLENVIIGSKEPVYQEKILGQAEVRKTFKHSDIGVIAGCLVVNGSIFNNSNVRVIRDGIVVYNGEINNLKHEKDNVKEIAIGKECGITIKKFNDIKINDIIESYSTV